MTASKAIANKPGVSEETRRRVQKAAKSMHYVPNALATSFRTHRTQSIGIVMNSGFSDIFPPLFGGIEAAATKCGLSTLLANHRDGGAKKFEDAVRLLAQNLDGLVVTSPVSLDEARLAFLDSLRLPYVLAMCPQAGLNVSTVQNNNRGGGRAMMEYLLSRDCRRFLLLPPDASLSCGSERFRGWIDALDAGRLPRPAAEDVVPIPSTVDAGYAVMKRLLAGGIRWDAAVCGSDHIAIGVIEALSESGVAIPGEIRVCGYDGIPLSEHTKTPLTTIRQPLAEIGETGVRLLNALIQDRRAPTRHVLINGRLTVRESA